MTRPDKPRRLSSDRPRASIARHIGAAVLLGFLAFAGGCQIFGFIAAGSSEYQKSRPRDVQGKYVGLKGKSFAVVVAADRVVQSSYPGVIEEVTARVSERLAQNTDAAGWVPPERLLAYLYSNPRWVAIPRGELARELEVDRLVLIDLTEFRLNEPGNQYVWDGMAAGTVSVIEADAPFPDEPAFQQAVRVSYPDKGGMTPADLPGQSVASVLVKRFVDRASWLFYTHKETGDMPY